MTLRLVSSFGLALMAWNAQAALLFSEYIEGSGLNKAVEIYNTDASSVDLSAQGCQVQTYFNGSSSSTNILLTGIIPAMGTYVLVNPDADFGGDQTGPLQFNGDDAVALSCNSGIVDVIGQIGTDPGSAWNVGGVSTQNATIRRMSAICMGDANGQDAFDPSLEWTAFGLDVSDDVGMHSANCGADTTPPTIDSITPSTLGPTAATSISFAVLFSEAVNGFSDPGDVTVNHAGTAHTDVSFNANSGAFHTVTVTGISGTGTLSLSVNTGSVLDGAGNANLDTLTSPDVTIDPTAMSALPDGLLLSEIRVTPNGTEFVEIFNNSADPIDLSDVYLTDATFTGGGVFYYQVVQGAGGGGDFDDFHARFPDGASIAPGAYQTIAIDGSDAFVTAFGSPPDYELYEDAGPDAVPDLREAFPGAINGQGALSDGVNNGEVLVLYYWDGSSDLVGDLDYALWGDRAEAVDKTGVTIDGPDPDPNASAYLADTPVANQAVIDLSEHAPGSSWQRVDFTEGGEIPVGGNGLSGHDETSEGFRLTWGEGLATPGSAPGPDVLPPGPSVLINEVNAVSADTDYLELFDGGAGGTGLDGLVLVTFDDTDQVTAAIDLDGLVTDASGYLLIGEAAAAPDLVLTAPLDDGAAAVALFIGNPADFPPGQAVSVDGLIDAVVYDSGQADDAGLLVLLEPGEMQVDEAANGAASSESLQRCPNGSGGRRRTATFQATVPTPGILNMNCPLGDYYAGVDDSGATVLRNTLHDTIDDHQWYPYSSSTTDTWDILELADEDPADSGMILDVYRNASYAKAGGGNANYNREHTWPRSLGLGETGTPLNTAATDAHNLRLSDIDYNGDRGNRPFAECDPMVNAQCMERTTLANGGVGGGSGVYPGNSNWVTEGVNGNTGSWETWNDRRGDVARSIFYMDIRYEGGSHQGTGLTEPNLELTDNRSLIQQTSGGLAYMGLLTVLLDWHQQDPVDSRELSRNDIVFSFQGNRNPFVDHPEWTDCIYADDCPTASELIFGSGFE